MLVEGKALQYIHIASVLLFARKNAKKIFPALLNETNVV